MRNLIGGMAAVAVLISLPAVADAQRRAATGGAKHEFGVDIGIAYVKPENVDGGIVIGTPVDLRLGFVSRSKVMWEPRVSLAFSTVGGETVYLFTPGVNVLYSMTPGGHRNGMYLTGGAGLSMGDLTLGSATALSLNGAIGWRKPWGGAAWRYELGIQYDGEALELLQPSTISIGGRIGVSLWK